MRIVGTIEARMGSTRLPGKTLTHVHGGMHLLECVVRRFKMARRVDEVVVATSTSAADDAIADWCIKNQVTVHRGSEDDVLDRVAGAATRYGADAIVQMGADSAYLDNQLIDRLIGLYQAGNYDYVCNDLKLTFPLGIYGHIVNVVALTNLNRRNDLTDKDREDVVRHFFERPNEYRIFNMEASEEFRYPQLRLTIDYPEDLELAKDLYARFNGPGFTTLQIIDLYLREPTLFDKTRNLVQRSVPHLRAK